MHAITHVTLSIALAYITGLPVVWFVIGGIFPDSDLLFSDILTHRVEFHSLLLVGLISLAIWKFADKRAGLAFAIGAVFHTICDIMTPMGVAIFWPFYNVYYTFNLSDSMYLDVTVILLSAFMIINHRKIKETLMSVDNFGKYFAFSIIGFFVITALFAGQRLIGCPSESTAIGKILSEKDSYSEKYVKINGTVCSNITEEYYASSGNTYQIFYLCQDNERVLVWKNTRVGDTGFNEDDSAYVCGVFTLKYSEPEITYVNNFGIIN